MYQKRMTQLKCSCYFSLRSTWNYCPKCAKPISAEQKKRPKRQPGSLKSLTRKLDEIFSKYIRLRDCPDGVGKCISCGKPHAYSGMDAGHFIGREVLPTRWDPVNVNCQDRFCNRFKEGEKDRYAEGLEKKYGPGTVDKLRLKANQPYRVYPDMLKALIAHYEKEVESLEAQSE